MLDKGQLQQGGRLIKGACNLFVPFIVVQTGKLSRFFGETTPVIYG